MSSLEQQGNDLDNLLSKAGNSRSIRLPGIKSAKKSKKKASFALETIKEEP